MPKPNLKFTVIYFSLFIVALFVARLFLVVLEPISYTNNIWAKSRIHQSLAGLDEEFKNNKPLVVFLGPSEIEVGFDPMQFDQSIAKRGLESNTLNLAVRNVGNFLPLYFARIRKEFELKNARAKVIFVQIPVSRMTKRSRISSAEASKSHDLPSAYFNFSIANDFPARIDELAYLAFNKYVLGERSLSQFTHSLRRPVRNWINDPSRAAATRADLWYHPDLHVEPAWDQQRKGYFNWNIDKKRRLVENLLKALPPARALQSSINYQNVCCDFEQLNIDWEYVEQVEHSLKSLHEVADQLVLVQLPENPDFMRNPESAARIKEVMQRLQVAAGAHLWTQDDLGKFNMFDFIDVIHFSSGGVYKFSDLLANHVPSEWLGSN